MKFTSKDLDYISDMFNWNYNALKVVNHYMNEVDSEEIKEILEEVFDMHYENMNKCVSILEGKNIDYDSDEEDLCECDSCECDECDCHNSEEEEDYDE